MKLVTVKIEVPASQKQVPEPKQRLDEGEFIIKRTVALKDLYNTLQGKISLTELR
jgi:ADP-ribose pyrophosphatase